jgi:predicted TIM-barrel fold metal-dependent hydrolase
MTDDCAMPPKPAVVDAHHHLWSLTGLRYEWLDEPGVAGETAVLGDYRAIRQDFGIEDLLGEIRPANVVRSVHVEAAASDSESIAETEWLQGIANVHGFPHAFVVAADLSASNAQAMLEHHLESPNVRGVRQRKGRDDPASAGFRDGLGLLRRFGLHFELNTDASQLSAFGALARANPDIPFVLGHAGLPRDRTPVGLQKWRTALAAFATNPNAIAKISGLAMFDHDWTQSSFRAIASQVIDIFSPERCMIGTNWPVDRLYGTYLETVDAYRSIASAYSADERDGILAANARRIYRI